MGDLFEISEITVTKKGRYALFCGGEFLFSVDEDTYVRHRIKKGNSYTREEIEQLRAASDYFSAKNKALELLGYRDHSEKELYDKLLRRYDEHTSALAVEKMRELSLVNDEAYAKKLVSELVRNGSKSRRAAAAKLYEKGISKELSESALSELDGDETDNIRAVVEKKYLRKLHAGERDKVYAALARLGFNSSDIKAVLSEYGGEAEEYSD